MTAPETVRPTRDGPRARPAWRVARLAADRRENARTRTLVLEVPGWPGHLPGQHVDVRLTAEDGYTATRSYSMSAPADGERVEITVQRVPDGEVSPYLTEDLPVGAEIEILGPVGGWFVWRPAPAPTLLIAGGAGIVPIMAMGRAWLGTGDRAQDGAGRDGAARGGAGAMRVIYSLRSPDLLCYRDDLDALAAAGAPVLYAYTRRPAPGGHRPAGRLTREEIVEHGFAADQGPACFVCGPTGFVEAVAAALIDLGHDPARVRTERFGPSGG
ncbi:FAD-binding oxidoreductase [Spirillospora sp. NPDC047279]|uniref:FAD-binding oxidoreductase n=1 Tax=Spirillospora sp. NPDC047279 TaxID=3155478 RepID=UPI003404285A